MGLDNAETRGNSTGVKVCMAARCAGQSCTRVSSGGFNLAGTTSLSCSLNQTCTMVWGSAMDLGPQAFSLVHQCVVMRVVSHDKEITNVGLCFCDVVSQ